ncbi:hypothetical protein [Bradyrhizobium sp. 195]|nr:hypothetical protein [Bradyrhizobium sp. 195]
MIRQLVAAGAEVATCDISEEGIHRAPPQGVPWKLQ